MKTTTTDSNAVTIRRISWATFNRLRPDLRPANDNGDKKTA